MSQVFDNFEAAVSKPSWPDALKNLNGLDMEEMLLALAPLSDSLLDPNGVLLNQPSVFPQNSGMMDRIMYAVNVVQKMVLPAVAPGDLQVTGQVQDATDFIAKYNKKIAWGATVAREFKWKVIDICSRLGMDPSDLMACMHSESGLDPGAQNIHPKLGLVAVGLIQFTSGTAQLLGTTLAKLSTMSTVDQLDYVERFFAPYRNRLKSVDDVYCSMFNVFGIGQPSDFVLYSKNGVTLGGRFYGPEYYDQNKILDLDKDGNITKGELSQTGRRELQLGLGKAA